MAWSSVLVLALSVLYLASFSVSSESSCRLGFRKIGDNCYQLNHNRLSWTGALAACASKGASLAFIPNGEVNTALYERLFKIHPIRSDYWFGLSDRRRERAFVWSSGQRGGFRNWQLNQPSHGDCAVFPRQSGGKWEVDHCNTRKYYICSTPTGGFPKGPCKPGQSYIGGQCYASSGAEVIPSPVAQCPGNFKHIAGRCYEVNNGKLTWRQAIRDCLLKKSALAFIPTISQNQILYKQHLRRDRTYWIGLARFPRQTSSFKWSSGGVSKFRHWASGQPDNTGSRVACAAFKRGGGGIWEDLDCAKSASWVCSRPLTD